MHPRILAQREADASARTVAAATKLAKRFGLEAEAKTLKAEEKQPEVQQMVRNEAVATFLETLVKTVNEEERQTATAITDAMQAAEEALLTRIGEIEGIGPKTLEAIRKALGEPAPEPKSETQAGNAGEKGGKP